MHDVERHDNVARHENDNVTTRDPLAAEPLPVDEAGLESGRGTRPDQYPGQETAPEHDVVRDDMVRDTDMVRDDDTVRDTDAMRDNDNDTVPDAVMVNGTETTRDGETTPDHDTELFAGDTVTRLRARWRELQADFVDDPAQAVREADEVVDEVVRTITEHRQRLAGEWQGHTDTEHLRLAMREYRTFVDRLLPTT
jgi:hypothetical protein